MLQLQMNIYYSVLFTENCLLPQFDPDGKRNLNFKQNILYIFFFRCAKHFPKDLII